MTQGAAKRLANKRMAMRLAVVTALMFGFGYALVPLYDIFCDITGLNGKTGVVQADTLDGQVDQSREVVVEFVANVNSALAWEFRPMTTRMRVHPGKIYQTNFYARNLSRHATVGQAVPSVTPGVAAKYFNKTECFCFTRQEFDGGEGREMPVSFVVGTELPKNIRTVTLAYTFFGVDSPS